MKQRITFLPERCSTLLDAGDHQTTFKPRDEQRSEGWRWQIRADLAQAFPLI